MVYIRVWGHISHILALLKTLEDLYHMHIKLMVQLVCSFMVSTYLAENMLGNQDVKLNFDRIKLFSGKIDLGFKNLLHLDFGQSK